jgi:hypothetical protein
MHVLGLAILIIGGSALFAVAGTAVIHRFMRSRISKSHNEVMIAVFGAAGVTYAVLLGFLVVAVWQAYDGAHRNVADEAASLVPLYRLTYGMEAKEGAVLRKLVREYADAVIHDEWPTLASGGRGSDRARKAIGSIDRAFAQMDRGAKAADAVVDAEFLHTKSIVISDRNQRLLSATDSIPWVMWLGAIGGGVIVVLMSWFLFMESLWPHALMAGLNAALIGLLLFIMTTLSTPFSGPLGLGPEHFEQAVSVLDADDRGY